MARSDQAEAAQPPGDDLFGGGQVGSQRLDARPARARSSSPPQLGQVPFSVTAAQVAQKVPRTNRCGLLVESGGRGLSQHSQLGRSWSMEGSVETRLGGLYRGPRHGFAFKRRTRREAEDSAAARRGKQRSYTRFEGESVSRAPSMPRCAQHRARPLAGQPGQQRLRQPASGPMPDTPPAYTVRRGRRQRPHQRRAGHGGFADLVQGQIGLATDHALRDQPPAPAPRRSAAPNAPYKPGRCRWNRRRQDQ